ncbi:hypothetical protein cypCar_00037064 [Cyprinus carpio]|nr:hypothetical protein cypCar_00037064 [Cyprinus carpio]
MGQTQSSWRLH